MRNLPDFPHINNINKSSDSLPGRKLVTPRKESKLSKGPRNTLHGKFVKNDRLIRKEIMRAIAKRNISLKVAEVCRAAKISSPTFYLHHSNCNEARKNYEAVILTEFAISKPVNTSKSATFELLLLFVKKHSYYFKSAGQACDMYVLTKMLQSIRYEISPTDISDEVYNAYAATLISRIQWWIKEDSLNVLNIPNYAQSLIKVRIMQY